MSDANTVRGGALHVSNLDVEFGSGQRTHRAVHDVSFQVKPGTTVGVVGQSGSGKTTIARTIVGLETPSGGSVTLDGAPILGREGRLARQRIQMIFQDPYSSLNPRLTVGATIDEALQSANRRTRDNPRIGGSGRRRREVTALLEQVRLEPQYAAALPRQLSGGQRQRVAIARTLAAQPDVIVADEITSALDVSVQGSILNLLRRLQRELGFTCLFISHNLAVVRYICDEVLILDRGKLVESGPVEEVLHSPRHTITRDLVDAVPKFGESYLGDADG